MAEDKKVQAANTPLQKTITIKPDTPKVGSSPGTPSSNKTLPDAPVKNKPAKKRRPKKKSNFFGYLGLFFVVALIVSGIIFLKRSDDDKKYTALAKQIAEYGPRKAVPKTIDDLKYAISLYEKYIDEHISAVQQTSTYWKILGTRYRDKGMHIEAMDAFEQALKLSPDEETLHYLLGMSAAQAAPSMYDTLERQAEDMRLYSIAEAAFLRAIELADDYSQARYALAVMYVFNLERPGDGIYQLERYMEGRSNDADAMFITGRAYYMLGDYTNAIYWYDRGIPLTKSKEQADEAAANISYMRSIR
jgi:tetratricopeptide (TPR) repeat protein